MRLDNTQIRVGDTVYDLEYGSGKVHEVTDAGIHVYLSSMQRKKLYNEQGMRRGAKRRVLYWHDPITAIPPKDAAKWKIVQDVASATVEALGGFNAD